jgi:lycopene beta-cyclase
MFVGNVFLSALVNERMIKDFDHIIAGGGCAGLSLAYHMHTLGCTGTMLIIDREHKTTNDRTWCSWSEKATPFDHLAQYAWGELSFADFTGKKHQSIGNYRYQLLRSADFYHHIRQILESNGKIHFITAEITDFGEMGEKAYVEANGQRFFASYLFNSTQLRIATQKEDKSLLQHFMGWWVHTKTPQFDPSKAMLMDFRVPQHGQTRFAYVLPVNQHLALVEYTVFSKAMLSQLAYEDALKIYLHQVLGITDYQIEEQEFGVIPMTNTSIAFSAGQRVVPIGTTGGAVKPSSGYAFQRIQQQTLQLARQIKNGELIDPRLPQAKRFRFYDDLLLHILYHHGHEAQGIFSRLFRKNQFASILRFLDEQSHIYQELPLLASLPIQPFLLAILERFLGLPWEKEITSLPAKIY